MINQNAWEMEEKDLTEVESVGLEFNCQNGLKLRGKTQNAK